MTQHPESSSTTLDPRDCSRCNREGGEEFQCMKKQYVFDVDKARKFVADGREVLELDLNDVEFSVGRCEINEGHLAHVDPTIPGIMAHVYFPDGDRIVHGHRLIDGHHRAARCLQLGIPYRIRLLSEEESIRVLTRSPKGARPNAKQRAEIASRQAEEATA